MEYYSRQMILPEVGEVGQKKLSASKCLVVGAGGLGSPALLYLAAAGVGTIGVCDFDRVSISNLHRQTLYSVDDVGRAKAEVAKGKLTEKNPHIKVIAHIKKASESLVGAYDLIFDCSDNFQTKFLLNDIAFLHKKPLIRASIYRFEGQMQSYLPERGDACLRCSWEDVPEEGCVGSCTQVGVLGPLPGFFGTLQAMEGIKWILGMPVLSKLLLYELTSHTQKKLTLHKNPACPLCGASPRITQIEPSMELERDKVDLDQYILVDIREKAEVEEQAVTHRAVKYLPLSSFKLDVLDPNCSYLFFCRSGRRSLHLVGQLRKEGFKKVYSLIGGIDQL